MDAEQPIIDENLIAELRNYAPTLHDEMFEEMHFIAAWRRDAARVKEINDDGYQPLALLIYEFIGDDWNAAMAEIRLTVEKLKAGDPNSALGLTNRLCKLRHSRLEKLGVILEWLKRAINDGDLIARSSQPPYVPLAINGRFGLKEWLDSKKSEMGSLWDKFPDGRIVVKASEVVHWLSKSGVAIPSCYRLQTSDSSARNTNPKTLTAPLRRQVEAIIEIIKSLGYEPDEIHDKKIKGEVREKALASGGRVNFKEPSFKKAWQAARDHGYIKP